MENKPFLKLGVNYAALAEKSDSTLSISVTDPFNFAPMIKCMSNYYDKVFRLQNAKHKKNQLRRRKRKALRK